MPSSSVALRARPVRLAKSKTLDISEFLLGSIVLNAILTALYHATGAQIFSVAINLAGAATIVTCCYFAFNKGSMSDAEKLLGASLLFTLFLGALINFRTTDPATIFKIVGPFALYYAGRSSGRWPRLFWPAIALLTLLPIAFSLVLKSKVATSWSAWSYFVTGNVACIYFTAIILACTVKLRRNLVVAQLVLATAMTKIGFLLATVGAIGLWSVLKPTVRSILVLLVCVMIAAVALGLGLLDRVSTVLAPMIRDFQTLGLGTIVRMDFATLVVRNQGTDLSGYFRLIHWTEILDHWKSGGVLTWLFGYGAGHTAEITRMRLVPHNDYLRYLAETGLISLGIFIAFLIRVTRKLPTVDAKIIFTVLLLYLGSDNLIDGFSTMAIFFVFAGMAAKAETARTTTKQMEALSPSVATAA